MDNFIDSDNDDGDGYEGFTGKRMLAMMNELSRVRHCQHLASKR